MIKQSTYYPEWQNNRINFILSNIPLEFFEGKRVLELGSHNGYISAFFKKLGCDVLALEGRPENILDIKQNYPDLNIQLANLDTPEWLWGDWDIIINFGLYYHLQQYHKEHLVNCIKNCKLMLFESVIFDSFESEIFFRQEEGRDQSLSNIGGTPSTSYVENILKENNTEFTKFSNPKLNGGLHHYDWIDFNSKQYNMFSRRFWIVKTNNI
jgi:2-polyprenyl-3-methyl-5-hydroxy-6-metoxy-1,4-benzoquinol methylase